MTEHTKEPWFINKESIDCPVGKLSIEANGDVFIAQVDDGDAQEANARRIVACVNACELISTDELESTLATGGLVNLRFNFYRVKEQRDQLLAALETLVEAHDTDCSDTDRRWALVDARLAITAVKG